MNDQKLEALVADGLLTVTEASQFLGVGRSKLYELMESGKLAFVKLGGCRRVPRRALIQLAVQHLVASQSGGDRQG